METKKIKLFPPIMRYSKSEISRIKMREQLNIPQDEVVILVYRGMGDIESRQFVSDVTKLTKCSITMFEKYLKNRIPKIKMIVLGGDSLPITDHIEGVLHYPFADFMKLALASDMLIARAGVKLPLFAQGRSGEYIARQDHDYLSSPHRLLKQLRFLSENHEVILVGTQHWLIDNHGHFLGFGRYKSEDYISCRWALCFGNNFVHTSVMFKREVVLNEFEGYDSNIVADDYDLFSRIASRYPVANLGSRIVSYRIHSQSTSFLNKGNFIKSHKQIAKENLQTVFLHREFSSNELDVILNFRYGLASGNVGGFLNISTKLFKDFTDLYPAAMNSQSLEYFFKQQLEIASVFAEKV